MEFPDTARSLISLKYNTLADKWIGRVRASDIVEIARRLQPQLKKVGLDWAGPCPQGCAREDGFAITPSKGVFICRPSGAGGDVISMVMHARRCGFNEACARITGEARPGLETAPRRRPLEAEQVAGTQRRPIDVSAPEDTERSFKREAALAIWNSAAPAEKTLVKTYLASRRLHLPTVTALRFHPGLRHPAGGVWPTMIALVTNGEDGARLAIHRTFLAHDGCGKAPIEPQKMMLGPCRGGVVRLSHGPDGPHALLIGEGIETRLAAMQASGYPAWAALSTSGLRTLNLPDDVRDVIVLADGDASGEAAAQDCARHWKREGRRVRIARPPCGQDFNDLLLTGARPARAPA
jgi:putative DNA primase/helicase